MCLKVWLTILLVTAFVTPAIEILLAQPLVIDLKTKITRLVVEQENEEEKDIRQVTYKVCCPHLYQLGMLRWLYRQETLDQCIVVQDQLVDLTRMILIGSVFGPVVPGLLVLVTVATWTRFCCLSWQEDELHRHTLKFGQIVSANVLVQQPVTVVACVGALLTWLVCIFIMCDLQFDQGAMIYYGLLNLISGCMCVWSKPSRKHRHAQSAYRYPEDCIVFTPHIGANIDAVVFRRD